MQTGMLPYPETIPYVVNFDFLYSTICIVFVLNFNLTRLYSTSFINKQLLYMQAGMLHYDEGIPYFVIL